MTCITKLSIDTVQEMMGTEATRLEATIMLGILSRECVVDTEEITPNEWEDYEREAIERAERESFCG